MSYLRLLFILLLVPQLANAQSDWKQQIDYTINVSLNPVGNLMEGDVTITYHNKSPNALNELYVHLWPNAYGNTETAFNKQLIEDGNKAFHLSAPEDKGFIFSLDFYVNEQKANWKFNSNHFDIAKIDLATPILPGETATITTSFVTIIPAIFSRMGRANGQFNLTQWYPKIAMYDADGWHPMPYLDMGEYYSNFGAYEVNITLPANYVVAATGELQNEDEISWLNEIDELTRDAVEREYNFDLVNRLKNSRKGNKTLTFKQVQVTDFAWFTSPDFLYLKKPVQVGDNIVEARTFITPDQIFLWEDQALDNIAYTLKFYSNKLGAYPYQHFTAVVGPLEAGGGMEYPMITVIDPTDNSLSLKTVIVHEVGHNWFQGMLASNERRYPWMDEGINSFYEEWALADEIGVKVPAFDERKTSKVLYYLMTSHRMNQPIDSHSEDLTNINYYFNGYVMPAVAFNYLREYLGTHVFDNAMKKYFSTWKMDHPSPKDLQGILEQESDKSLNWFFKDLFSAETPPDYKVKSLIGSSILVKNNTNIPNPFTLDYLDENGELLNSQWVEGFTGEKSIDLVESLNGVHKITIFHDELYPEISRQNNSIKTSGRFPKSDGISFFSPKEGIEGVMGSNAKSQVFTLPVVAWNATDQLMLGASFTNTFLNEKKVEYTAYPMYSITNQDINGFGEVKYNWYNDNGGKIKKVQPYVNVRHFNYDTFRNIELDYYHGEAGVNVAFKKPRERDGVQKNLSAKFTYNLEEPFPGFNTTSNTYFRKDFTKDWFIDLTYSRDNDRKFNPNILTANVQHHKDFTKTSAEYKYRYDFGKTDHSLKFRAFAGAMLRHKDTAPVRAYFTAMGRDATYDYDYSKVYLDRTNGTDLANNLIYNTDGGLKLKENFAFPVDVLGQWMGAINLEAPIPIDLPLFNLGAYGDIVLLQPLDIALDNEINMLYDAGLKAGLGNVLKVYYPLVFSNEFKPDNGIEELTFTNKLVFTLDLNPLHLKDGIRNIFKKTY